MNTLFEHDMYINKNIEYLISKEIIEYDIKSAGYNLCKHFKLLPDAKIDMLSKLSKKERQTKLGMLLKYDKNLVKKLSLAFKEARKWFFETNNLTEDDIISINKDALFITKKCHNLKIGHIEFVEKNQYTSYYYFNRYQFYYSKDKGIDVKGISDENLEKHRSYMLDILKTLFNMLEVSDKKVIIKVLKDFSYYYKRKELDIGYYRELNVDSLYRTDETLLSNVIFIEDTEENTNIDIGYNYINYIVPIINLIL